LQLSPTSGDGGTRRLLDSDTAAKNTTGVVVVDAVVVVVDVFAATRKV